MLFFRKLKRRLRWYYYDLIARLGIGDAEVIRQGRRPAYGKADPRLLSVPLGREPFQAHDVLHGSYSCSEHCAGVPNSIWVDFQSGGECIRYYPSELDDKENSVALLYFPGDVTLRTARGVRLVGTSYTSQTPDDILAIAREWAKDSGAPAIYVGRPGIFGSSGDHEKRRLSYEIDIMDRFLTLLRDRYGIGRFILVGQSGGAQIAAALLNQRSDVDAIVVTSGLLSVHYTVRRWRRIRPVPGGPLQPVDAFYDPMQWIGSIKRDPQPGIYIVSDPRDAVVPFYSQLQYVKKLQSEGLQVHHIYAHGSGAKRHSLGAHGRKIASMIAQGKSLREIRLAMVDMDLMNINGGWSASVSESDLTQEQR